MKKLFLSSLFIILIMNSWGQDKKERDIKAIKALGGCFKVNFNFAETFKYTKDSTYKPSKTFQAEGLEWVEIIKENNNEIQLQHLLIVGTKEKPHIIKHWRQDWLFENQDLYLFDKNAHWKFVKLSKDQVKGQWTHKVFQVDDSPRFEASATWVHVDGKSYWETKMDAPLPRREYTKRNDYNVLLRNDRYEITQNGWVNDQDNDKIIRKDGAEDLLLAREKGVDTYTKVADSKCEAAQKWWKENKHLWRKVLKKWTKTFALQKDITLRKKVNKKPLYHYLFKMDVKSSRKQIDKVIDNFIK